MFYLDFDIFFLLFEKLFFYITVKMSFVRIILLMNKYFYEKFITFRGCENKRLIHKKTVDVFFFFELSFTGFLHTDRSNGNKKMKNFM